MSRLLTAQGSSYHCTLAVLPAPCTIAVPAQPGTALPTALAPLAGQAPKSLPKSLQAEGWWVWDQDMAGSVPLPGQWQGGGMCLLRVLLGALPGKGHMLGSGAVQGTCFWTQRRARERGKVWFTHGSRWLGTEERPLSSPGPSSGIVARTHRQRQGLAAGHSVPAHSPLGRDRAWAKGTRRGSKPCPAPGYLGHGVPSER